MCTTGKWRVLLQLKIPQNIKLTDSRSRHHAIIKLGRFQTTAAALRRALKEQEVAKILIKLKANNASLGRFLSLIHVAAGMLCEWHIIAQSGAE